MRWCLDVPVSLPANLSMVKPLPHQHTFGLYNCQVLHYSNSALFFLKLSWLDQWPSLLAERKSMGKCLHNIKYVLLFLINFKFITKVIELITRFLLQQHILECV